MPGSPNVRSGGNTAMQEAMHKMEARLSKLELAYTAVRAEVRSICISMFHLFILLLSPAQCSIDKCQ